MTPRVQHADQFTDAPQEEGLCTRPTPQGGNPEGPRGPGLSWNLMEKIAAPASAIAGGSDDPFRSEGTGLTRNLARRLDDSVPFFAPTAMNTEVNGETGEASPTPANQPQARTEIRKRRLASQTQWDDQTTQMIGKIFRAIFRLEDKVEKVAKDVATVKEHTEYMGSRVRYELHTEAPAAHSGVGTPPHPPPLRGELDRLREEVQAIQRQQGEVLGELQVNLKKNQDLASRIENKVEVAIGTAIQNGKATRPPGSEEKAQSKAKDRVAVAQVHYL